LNGARSDILFFSMACFTTGQTLSSWSLSSADHFWRSASARALFWTPGGRVALGRMKKQSTRDDMETRS